MPSNLAPSTKQQSSLHLHHSYQNFSKSSLFDNQSVSPTPPSQLPNLYNYPPNQDSPGNQTQSSNTMMSQAPSHQFDHHLAPQPSHSNHHRHVSNASSVGSLGCGHPSFDPSHYAQANHVHDNFVVPASFPGTVSGGAAFGGVPVSAESFHQYAPHHQRSSSTSSSSSPYTEPSSVSEGNSPDGTGGGPGIPGGRKASQAQMMRRARAHASPYAIRTESLSWNGIDHPGSSASSSATSLARSNSVASDVASSTEEELAELIRSQSRESSAVSDWNPNGASSHQLSQTHTSPVPHHHQTGLGSAGAFMDPYAAVANVHGHAGAFGPTMVSLGNGGPANLGGIVSGGMVGANGMFNSSLVGGMGAQMGRMTLDSTETYEALAHHIRTAVTTSAADRARQAFVQAWLNSSYISYTDGNVSRQGLYGSYLRICQQYDIKPINSASFGKAVRQSFPNIKTRRLGVRGNSKYHYCGIRPATAKEAEILMNLSRSEQPEQCNGGRATSSTDDDLDSDESPNRRLSQASSIDESNGFLSLDCDGSQPQTPRTARPNMTTLGRVDLMPNGCQAEDGSVTSNGSHIGQSVLFPSLEDCLNLPTSHDLDHQRAREFWKAYTEHVQCLLDSVKNYRFDQFELSLRTFWAGLDSSNREIATHPTFMSLVYRADAAVYDEILEFLHSQTMTQMPQQAFGSLRQLAQSMEQVIIAAMENYPSSFVGPKIELAARFGHLIVRHLGICQLAQALSGVFNNPNSLKEMVEAWDGIDFEAVRNQAALVTNCQHEILGACFEDFRQILINPSATIEHFISFVEVTYERCLQPINDGERGLSPRSLLVRWCFVSSQLIRDLTLRSASSFGLFQIVNLFFDEWLGFKVLRKVALHVAAVAASVDATSPELSDQLTSQGYPQGGSSAAIYSTSSQQSNQFQGYAGDGFDLDSNQLRQDRIGSDGVAPSLTNNSSSAGLNNDEFVFSSNTSQAFVMAQQQVAAANGDSLSPGTAQQASSQSMMDSSSKSSECSSLTALSSKQDSRSGDCGQSQNNANDSSHSNSQENGDILGSGGSNSFDDKAFSDLLDVSGFGMSVEGASNSLNDEDKNQSVSNESSLLNSGSMLSDNHLSVTEEKQ
ncbi:hypothetical protein BY996DRAFT_4587593 [Phakopsora pachyrhizi]|uniref:RFX-type winged-helix domain-containing protein n=1 Tax=Phakopsora pachyrhizi TaxID=170000 RepID=A0AAV0AKP6_PHAPC|nr:hypothetical protein BY996DRAFT_4587593 [Phakopsora pachyrhizi]CAH7667904.1 hypothetical protein PPACK8108_LOCUS2346 [Phakopsora pachyrhizi]